MKQVTLKKMGMDFYGEETGDMGNFRLRPTINGDEYLKDKDGRYIAGDFQYHRGNKYHPDALGWDFTDYGTDKNDMRAYRGLKKYFWHTLEPTLANIKMLLEEILGEEITLTIEK